MNNQQNWYYEGLFLFNKNFGEDSLLMPLPGQA